MSHYIKLRKGVTFSVFGFTKLIILNNHLSFARLASAPNSPYLSKLIPANTHFLYLQVIVVKYKILYKKLLYFYSAPIFLVYYTFVSQFDTIFKKKKNVYKLYLQSSVILFSCSGIIVKEDSCYTSIYLSISVYIVQLQKQTLKGPVETWSKNNIKWFITVKN